MENMQSMVWRIKLCFHLTRKNINYRRELRSIMMMAPKKMRKIKQKIKKVKWRSAIPITSLTREFPILFFNKGCTLYYLTVPDSDLHLINFFILSIRQNRWSYFFQRILPVLFIFSPAVDN